MRSAEEIYQEMLAVFTEKTGFSMDGAGDVAVRLYAAAAQIESLYLYSDWALAQSFPQTAQGEYLDRHGAMRGVARKAAEKASGTVRFSVNEARGDAVDIPAGTVLMTTGLTRFVTKAGAAIAAGSLSADVPAEAERAAEPLRTELRAALSTPDADCAGVSCALTDFCFYHLVRCGAHPRRILRLARAAFGGAAADADILRAMAALTRAWP